MIIENKADNSFSKAYIDTLFLKNKFENGINNKHSWDL